MSKQTEQNYYATLGILSSAKPDQIKKAYWRLAEEHHPDKGGDENLFKRVCDAYEVLSHPEKRAMYDRGEDPSDFKSNADKAKERINTLVGSIIHANAFMADYTDVIVRLREEINEIDIQYHDEIASKAKLVVRYDSLLKRLNNCDFIVAFIEETKAHVLEKIDELKNDLEIQKEMICLLEEAAYAVDPDDYKAGDNGKQSSKESEEEKR